MGQHRVTRFAVGSAHGWYVGRNELWGLLPGDEGSWVERRLAYSEAARVRLGDLRFAGHEERAEFVRDLGL